MVPPVEAQELFRSVFAGHTRVTGERDILCYNNSQTGQTPQPKVPLQLLLVAESSLQSHFIDLALCFEWRGTLIR